MKLLKKAGAVVLVLAMIAVLMPQLGSVVKAAATGTYVYNVSKKDSYFTLNENGAGALATNSGAKATNFTSGGYKTGNQTFDFTVPADKYAVVEFNMLLRYSNKPCYYVVKKGTEILAQELTTQYPDLRIGPTQTYDSATVVDSEHFILPVVCEAGTYTIARDESTKNEAVLYQIKVTEYDTQEEATTIVDTYVKTITEKPKYTLSGTITSEVDLTDGTVSLSSKTAGASAATVNLISNGNNTYSYTVSDMVGGGAVYNVSIESPALAKAKKLVDSAALAQISFTLDDADKTDADFTVPYKDITNIWDFSTIADWSSCSYQGSSEEILYKGLLIDVSNTATSAKFATNQDSQGVGRIQINKGTKVKIPVSGWGTIKCTFGGAPNGNTTLGTATGDGTNNGSISFNYENATYVELSVGTDNDNLYLKKIEVTPDTTNPPVSTLGASVRQETAEWGNGIRFGGQLNLNKVEENSTSGTLIGLKSVVNDATMTLEDVQKTCINVVRTTYITQDESSLEYAAALINIPDDNLDTEIVARPYVTIGDNTYYGEQITITYNTAQKIVNGQ